MEIDILRYILFNSVYCAFLGFIPLMRYANGISWAQNPMRPTIERLLIGESRLAFVRVEAWLSS